tara:strand:- start:4365 stop:4826 length:462 start_codon:yes stop_codon:yes gene_type:complete
MEVEELRIGNLVTTVKGTKHFGKPLKVEFITNNNCYDLDAPLDSINGYNINEVIPIPLTEEWLIRLGFEKSKGNFSIDFNLGYLELEYHVIMDLWEFNIVNVGDAWDEPVSMPLKSPQHVHQLQNLYFALTGEDFILNTSQALTLLGSFSNGN